MKNSTYLKGPLKRLRTARELVVISLSALVAVSAFAADTAGFALKDEPGKHLDVLHNGRILSRYMYAYDTSTPAARLKTYKPYLHFFDATGKAPITKGAGGSFPHHRGIYLGWNS